MPEPSPIAFIFAAFLFIVAAGVSYLHLDPGIEAAALLFSGFVLGYRMGLPVVPPEVQAAGKK